MPRKFKKAGKLPKGYTPIKGKRADLIVIDDPLQQDGTDLCDAIIRKYVAGFGASVDMIWADSTLAPKFGATTGRFIAGTPNFQSFARDWWKTAQEDADAIQTEELLALASKMSRDRRCKAWLKTWNGGQ